MKIKLATIYASPHLTAHPGSVIDVSDEEGRQLVSGRFGIEVPDEVPAPHESPTPESAAVSASENAALRTGRIPARPRTPAE